MYSFVSWLFGWRGMMTVLMGAMLLGYSLDAVDHVGSWDPMHFQRSMLPKDRSEQLKVIGQQMDMILLRTILVQSLEPQFEGCFNDKNITSAIVRETCADTVATAVCEQHSISGIGQVLQRQMGINELCTDS